MLIYGSDCSSTGAYIVYSTVLVLLRCIYVYFLLCLSKQITNNTTATTTTIDEIPIGGAGSPAQRVRSRGRRSSLSMTANPLAAAAAAAMATTAGVC